MTIENKARGSLLGLALGDALGTSLEFTAKDSYQHITDMNGGGPFDLEPGQWTDDTSMMLCLTDSLIDKGINDPVDQMNRYLRWFMQGENSCTGSCFDIGNTVRSALTKFETTGNALSGSNEPYTAGNGSLMRLAPIPLFFYQSDLKTLFTEVQVSSETTHAEPRCVQACQLMSYYLQKLYKSTDALSKDELLQAEDDLLSLVNDWDVDIASIVNGEYLDKTRDDIFGTGFVVQSLEAALWCFYLSNDFEHGALLAANLGDDADTTAAIYGQLAGAYYGYDGLPEKWLNTLYWKSDIEQKSIDIIKIIQRKNVARNMSKIISNASVPIENSISPEQQEKFTGKLW